MLEESVKVESQTEAESQGKGILVWLHHIAGAGLILRVILWKRGNKKGGNQAPMSPEHWQK